MKRLLLAAICALPGFAMAQTLLYNDGATIKIDPGAVLVVEGGVINTASGIINNDGTLEIQGNFVNQGSYDNAQPNTLRFTGTAASTVTPGTAQFHQVVIQKTGANVILGGNMTVTNNLNFNSSGSSNLVLGAFELTMGASATAVTGADSDEFVVTGGAGSMKKIYNTNGAYTFPVGFNSSTYNPATVNKVSGPNETVAVRVGASPTNGNGSTGTPITTDVVDAVWLISETTAGGNTYSVTLGWAESDELPGFDDLLNCVSRNDGTNGWDGLFSDLGPESGNTRSRTGLSSLGTFAVGDKTVANELKVNLKVLLQGPYVSGLMVDSLRDNGLLPLSEPYTSLPSNPYGHQAYGGGESVSSSAIFNQPANGDDIVDWLVVELRSASTPTSILATKTGLLQRDGNVVDLDGSSVLSIPGLADGNYHIGIRHRNHLGIRTSSSHSLNNSVGSLIDLTQLSNVFDDASITKPTEPMRLLTAGVYGLWAGDANFNGLVSYNGGGNDKNVILAALSGNPNNVVATYSGSDLNMNGITSYNGGSNDKNVILANLTAADLNTPMSAHNNN